MSARTHTHVISLWGPSDTCSLRTLVVPTAAVAAPLASKGGLHLDREAQALALSAYIHLAAGEEYVLDWTSASHVSQQGCCMTALLPRDPLGWERGSQARGPETRENRPSQTLACHVCWRAWICCCSPSSCLRPARTASARSWFLAFCFCTRRHRASRCCRK